ncbi:hypothetical protein LCGC14_3111680 [marine sediment metagenome]|uniref:Uncharacterized protein n=1 Tax=marine sediment metagenome TaxID=412755 RepID=A0A0F8W588_9ZZZZ
MKSKESRPETKDSNLIEILNSGWVIRKKHIPRCKEYIILVRGNEEMIYDGDNQRIVSLYKR